MIWIAVLSNDARYDEASIADILPNPSKVTPWLLLQSHCAQNNLTIKSIVLWDSESSIRLYSPGNIATLPADAIDLRRRHVASTKTIGKSQELTGILITKNKVTFGIWCDTATKEVFTTIEG